MANEQVATNDGENKTLGVTRDNIEQAAWECDTAMAKLNFLSKMLKQKDEYDEADMVLTFYERNGLASQLQDVVSHLSTVWSEIIAPIESHFENTKEEARHG